MRIRILASKLRIMRKTALLFGIVCVHLSCTDNRFDLNPKQKQAVNITDSIAFEIDTSHISKDSTNFVRLRTEHPTLFSTDCDQKYFYQFHKDSKDSAGTVSYSQKYLSRIGKSTYLFLRVGRLLTEDEFFDSFPYYSNADIANNIIYGTVVNYCDSCCN